MRKLISLILVALFLASFFITSSYADSGTVAVEVEKARQVALYHIASEMQVEENETWGIGVGIVDTTIMYDFENKPSCYLFELGDKLGNAFGYIVIGASSEFYPVIEFANTGNSFTEVALRTLASGDYGVHSINKIYYVGGLNYFVEADMIYGDSSLFSLASTDLATVSMKEIETVINEYKNSSEYQDILANNTRAWERWSNVISSNPPSSGGFITDPSIYENGYDDYYSDNVVNYNRSYNPMTKFSNIDGVSYTSHCAPTAGTNVMFYWYYRNTSKYRALYDNRNWLNSFVELHTLMKTDSGGTGRVDNEEGLEKYFTARNIGHSISIDRFVSVGDIKGQIGADKPFVTCLSNHYMYGNHAVFTLGYRDYVYEHWYGDNHSMYLRIYDGWDGSGYPNRFVHKEVGLTELDIITISVN